MPVIALVSAKSCGVTTTALALTLASKKKSLLAECDPAGGTIRAGFASGYLAADTGLYHLAAADRTGPEALTTAFSKHLWHLDPAGERNVLAGLTDPSQAASLSRTWPSLSQVLHLLSEGGYNVLIDAGRLAMEAGHLHPTLTPAPLIHQADLVLLVVRSNEQSLALARHVVEPLRAELAERGTGPDALGLLLLEEGGGYRPHHVQDALGVPVMAGLPWDPATAHYLTFGGRPPRGFDRTRLMRHARSSIEQLEALASRRQIQQQMPDRMKMAGVLQRLHQLETNDGEGDPRV